MNRLEAEAVAGTLGHPSKMPGTAYGIPATACKTGAKLAKIPGSVCYGCYALKGNYTFKSTIASQERRLLSLDSPHWVDAMTALIVGSGTGWHRWHDAGDLQSVAHLRKIVAVAERTPAVGHWLPTREGAMLKAFLTAGGIVPRNLTIRLSATMVDGPVPTWWPTTSAVYTKEPQKGSQVCPAPKQGNECGPCRDCWKRTVKSVTYKKH